MKVVGVFPFGQPVLPVVQRDRAPKQVFVLGVYASAVHARWVGADGRQRIAAVAVASEPEIFWRGGIDAARAIIDSIAMPPGAGRLVPADDSLNGPSGRALDDLYLAPLGLSHHDAWLCDLVPHSCMNGGQADALKRAYDPARVALGLPEYRWPAKPQRLATAARRAEIEAELMESRAEVLITLGDEPLKWFASRYGATTCLGSHGRTEATYGKLHPLEMAGRKLRLLPLAHPRQAARLGSHDPDWARLHDGWVADARTRCRLN